MKSEKITRNDSLYREIGNKKTNVRLYKAGYISDQRIFDVGGPSCWRTREEFLQLAANIIELIRIYDEESEKKNVNT